MKSIVKAIDLFALGMFFVNVACKFISNEAFGKALFVYLVIRFILKRTTK